MSGQRRDQEQDVRQVVAGVLVAAFLLAPAHLVAIAAAAVLGGRVRRSVYLVLGALLWVAFGVWWWWTNGNGAHFAWHVDVLTVLGDADQLLAFLGDTSRWAAALVEQTPRAALPIGAAALAVHLEQREPSAGRRPDVDQKAKAKGRPARIPTRWPATRQGRGVLGVHLAGDLPDWRTRRGLRRRGRWIAPPDEAYTNHGAVIGQSGSGKTITLVELARIAAAGGAAVHYLDCKGYGSGSLPAAFATAMLDAGVPPGRIRLWPEERYDLWRGTPGEVANRLLACIDYTDAPYFEDVASDLVHSALADGTPGSAREFLDRLNREAGNRKQLVGQHADTAVKRFVALFAAVRDGQLRQTKAGEWERSGTLFDGGWAFEDADASLLSIPGLGQPKFARAAGRLLLADLEHYATVRKPAGDRGFVVVDELGTLGAGSVVNIIERVREAGVGVVVSAQTVAGLGDQAEAVLQAVSWVLLHRTAKPQPVIDLAGTHTDARRTWSVGAGERMTGSGAWAERDRWLVDPNEARRLPVGQGFVISGGAACRMQVAAPADDTPGAAWLADRAAERVAAYSDDGDEPTVEVVDVDGAARSDAPWIR